jgi:hypothetical protein
MENHGQDNKYDPNHCCNGPTSTTEWRRNHHEIAVFRETEWAERGEITLEAAAKLIGVCNMTALRMLRRGEIKGRQACAGAPWVIKAEDLAGFTRGKRRKPPLTPDATQQVVDFQ